MIARRTFLTGLGGLITTAFMGRVARHVAATGEPLFVAPPAAVRSLYVTPDGPHRFLVTDGPREVMAPWPPSWREFLAKRGVDLASRAARAQARQLYEVADLDAPVPQGEWEGWWTRHGPTPEREAFDYLGRLAIGPTLATDTGEPALTLVDGFSPICTCPMAFLNGPLAISLLQARLVELGEPTALILAEGEG